LEKKNSPINPAMLLKNFKFFFCFKLIFLVFLNRFDILILKINLKKYYFNTFSNKKYFKKQYHPFYIQQ